MLFSEKLILVMFFSDFGFDLPNQLYFGCFVFYFTNSLFIPCAFFDFSVFRLKCLLARLSSFLLVKFIKFASLIHRPRIALYTLLSSAL